MREDAGGGANIMARGGAHTGISPLSLPAYIYGHAQKLRWGSVCAGAAFEALIYSHAGGEAFCAPQKIDKLFIVLQSGGAKMNKMPPGRSLPQWKPIMPAELCSPRRRIWLAECFLRLNFLNATERVLFESCCSLCALELVFNFLRPKFARHKPPWEVENLAKGFQGNI